MSKRFLQERLAAWQSVAKRQQPSGGNSKKVSFVNEYQQPAGRPGEPAPAQQPSAPGQGHYVWRVVSGRGTGWAVAAILAGAVVGLSIIDANPGPPPAGVVVRGAAGGPLAKVFTGPGGRRVQITAPGAVPGAAIGLVGPGGPIIARLVPPGGGLVTTPLGQVVTGTVSSVSKSGFTVSTAGNRSVTVNEQSSTAYRQGNSPARASAVTKGARVLVLGSQSGTAITASVVAVLSG